MCLGTPVPPAALAWARCLRPWLLNTGTVLLLFFIILSNVESLIILVSHFMWFIYSSTHFIDEETESKKFIQ